MRLKNKKSIAFSIAKTKHAENTLVIGWKRKTKKNANELLITVQSHYSIAFLLKKLSLRRLPDIVENPVCVRFLTTLTHISAERPVVVAHIGTTRNAVHTALDDTALLQ